MLRPANTFSNTDFRHWGLLQNVMGALSKPKAAAFRALTNLNCLQLAYSILSSHPSGVWEAPCQFARTLAPSIVVTVDSDGIFMMK